jgi:CrcB protein
MLDTAHTQSGRHRAAGRRTLAAVGAAGALGALARYGLGGLLPAPAGGFPWGTFWVNVSGSILIGIVLVLLRERFPTVQLARPLVVTGFLGAYTTYSTYVVGTDLLLRSHDVATALAYLLASLVAGVGGAFAGVAATRAVLQGRA